MFFIFHIFECFFRRQSSGSSFLSKSEADADDQIGSFGDKFEPQTSDPFLPPLPPPPLPNDAAKNPSLASTVAAAEPKWSVISFDSDSRAMDNSLESEEMSSERQSLGRLSFLMDDNSSNNKVFDGGQQQSTAHGKTAVRTSQSSNTAESTVSGSAESSEKKKDLQSTGAIPKKHRQIPAAASNSLSSSRFGNGFNSINSIVFDKGDKKEKNFFKNFKLSSLKSTLALILKVLVEFLYEYFLRQSSTVANRSFAFGYVLR